jgi:pyridinium-3,5-bisthiocarboxylic acid mononucleotide nickel chelatase
MKTLYLDIFSGISGDMFLGAMIDLGVDAHALEHELEKLGLPGWHLHVRRAVKANIEGVKFDVHEAHEHHHHGHEHEHHEHHDHGHHQDHLAGQSHGPHGGPLVDTSAGRVELSVFETGVPPRFRLYFFDSHGHAAKPSAAKEVSLETIRPNGKRQSFRFQSHHDFLEATAELPEPHEFTALLKLKHGRRTEKAEVQFVEDHHHHGHGEHHHGHDHHHHGDDEHDHEHHGRTFADIRAMIEASTLSKWVKTRAVAVFHRIAVAEGKVHGHPPEEVHFHEVGAIDSIVDIVGACIALELLGKPRVLAAPVVEGTGWVNCAHGRFPVPTMATLAILGARGVALTQCDEPHELVTPTGAALLAEFVGEFGPMRGLVAERIGYGLGTRDNHTRPNVLRAVLGKAEVISHQSSVDSADWETDTIAVLETNLDDISAELLGHFVERALAAGALDVFHTPIQMKKNRPGVLLTVLCAGADADKFAELILRETTAFGVRRTVAERRKLQRESVSVKTAFGPVTVKLGKLNGKVVQAAPEFESCKAAAEKHRVALKAVYEAAQRAAAS